MQTGQLSITIDETPAKVVILDCKMSRLHDFTQFVSRLSQHANAVEITWTTKSGPVLLLVYDPDPDRDIYYWALVPDTADMDKTYPIISLDMVPDISILKADLGADKCSASDQQFFEIDQTGKINGDAVPDYKVNGNPVFVLVHTMPKDWKIITPDMVVSDAGLSGQRGVYIDRDVFTWLS